jgi:hypothetical protein
MIELRGLRRVAALVLMGIVGTLLLVTAGCGGPERAPRQPITGVDRPADTRAPNPYDEPENTAENPEAPANR